MQDFSPAARFASLFIAVIALFALGLQLQILIANFWSRGESIWQALVLYLGFFTILTNALVMAVAVATGLRSGGFEFFTRHSAHTAVAAYIAIVMLIYELTLRKLWNPQGAQWLADLLLHNVAPVMYVLWWLIFTPKGGLRYADAIRWLAYPLIYLAYALVRGAITGLYPYPFIDVSQNGYAAVALSSLMVSMAFLSVCCLFIAIDRALSRRNDR